MAEVCAVPLLLTTSASPPARGAQWEASQLGGLHVCQRTEPRPLLGAGAERCFTGRRELVLQLQCYSACSDLLARRWGWEDFQLSAGTSREIFLTLSLMTEPSSRSNLSLSLPPFSPSPPSHLPLPCRCSLWQVPRSASPPHIFLEAPSHLGCPSTRS